jgi:hypothetical protein
MMYRQGFPCPYTYYRKQVITRRIISVVVFNQVNQSEKFRLTSGVSGRSEEIENITGLSTVSGYFLELYSCFEIY